MDTIVEYRFTRNFFRRRNAVKPYVKIAYSEFNDAAQGEKPLVAIVHSTIIDRLLQETKDINSRIRLRIAQSDLLWHAAMLLDSPTLFEVSYTSITAIDYHQSNGWDAELVHAYHYIAGNAHMSYYEHVVDKDGRSNYELSRSEVILRAKYHYSIIINTYLSGTISITRNNTQDALNRYCHVLGLLSRYAEPFNFLHRLRKARQEARLDSRQSELYLLQAIKENTCSIVSPVMLLRMDRHVQAIKREKSYGNYRSEEFKSQATKTSLQITNYCTKNSINRKEIADYVDRHDRGLKNLEDYNRFVAVNHLSLNETGIYCRCADCIKDSLSIKSGCDHTHIDWIQPFQILLEDIKRYYSLSRKSYFDSLGMNGSSGAGGKIDESLNSLEINFSMEAASLCRSFRDCFGVLDKLAHLINLIHGIYSQDERYKIDFLKFFNNKSTKILIDESDRNLFLFALFTIARDLDASNEFASFPEFKKWRNAVEHDTLMLVNANADINSLKFRFPFIREFVNEDEFKEKTMFLLQLCRSAIFSSVWHVRKVSIGEYKNNVPDIASSSSRR